jgi:hypothetical protein
MENCNSLIKLETPRTKLVEDKEMNVEGKLPLITLGLMTSYRITSLKLIICFPLSLLHFIKSGYIII